MAAADAFDDALPLQAWSQASLTAILNALRAELLRLLKSPTQGQTADQDSSKLSKLICASPRRKRVSARDHKAGEPAKHRPLAGRAHCPCMFPEDHFEKADDAQVAL